VQCRRHTEQSIVFATWRRCAPHRIFFIVQFRTFKCSLDHAKRSLYRVVNGIFGRIGRMASLEVILEVIKTKCLPDLLYGLEVCPLSKTNLRSLDFPINLYADCYGMPIDIQLQIA